MSTPENGWSLSNVALQGLMFTRYNQPKFFHRGTDEPELATEELAAIDQIATIELQISGTPYINQVEAP